ncbi:MAG: PepSY-like domain-containing protein [bacterium]|nr:PepSY-like domain-containing protein [bacterium]
MKTIIFAVCVLLIASRSDAQSLKDAEVPSVVKTSFSSLYPDAKKVKWEMEDGNYEAEFDQNNVETSVILDAKGTFLQKEVEIPVSELPEAVKNYASTNVAGKTIDEAAKITDAAGIVKYEAEIGKADYIFDQNGSLLKKEKEDGEDKEEKDDDDK